MKKPSQKENVLAHLQAGARNIKGTLKYYATITPLDAMSMYGAFRLSGIIYSLKKDNHTFETTLVQNEYGNYFAKYKLI